MITAQMAARGNEPASANAKRLTANWQNGLEAGNQVQRKLRLTFTDLAAASAGKYKKEDIKLD
jgi:hypothetical protein